MVCASLTAIVPLAALAQSGSAGGSIGNDEKVAIRFARGAKVGGHRAARAATQAARRGAAPNHVPQRR